MRGTERPADAARRAPVQDRSTLRVNLMLDAAADLLVEGGYPAVTTSAVAARAGVSIGSLYQYFPDRDAVLQVLGRRAFDRFVTLLSDRIRTRRPRTWQDVLDVVIDGFLEFTRGEPSGRALLFGSTRNRRIINPGVEGDNVLVLLLGQLLVSVRPDLTVDESLRRTLHVAVESAVAVLELALTGPSGYDVRIVDEARAMVRAYLAEKIPPRPGPSST